MLMSSMREIKRRKASIQSTAQITKAMKLVSTVKYQKAKSRAEDARPYFEKMYETMSTILSKADESTDSGLVPGDSKNAAVIVITSNRGLAGGYNINVVKQLLNSGLNPENVKVYAVGTKGRDMLIKRGYALAADYSEVLEGTSYRDIQDIMETVLKAYRDNEVGSIYLAYTHFKNTVTHIPKLIKVLPADTVTPIQEEKPVAGQGTESEDKPVDNGPMNFEPEESEVLEALIPKYITSLVYGAMMESAASENGARMTAMDNATSNAEEMIDDLELKYNRARQGEITQEITEIVSGSEAMA